MIRSRWIEHEKYIYIQVLLPAFSAEKLIRRAGALNWETLDVRNRRDPKQATNERIACRWRDGLINKL